MIALLSILTALLVLWHERRHPGVASDLNALGIFSALAAIVAGVGSAIGSAAGAVGGALGSVGSAIGEAGSAVGSALGAGAGGGAGAAAGTGAATGGAADIGAATGAGISAVGPGTALSPAEAATMFPGSSGASALTASPAAGSTFGVGQSATKPDVMGQIEKLASMKKGGGDKGGGQQAAPPPAFHPVAPSAPFQVPQVQQSPGLANLVASIQARRQRLAQLGLGGGGFSGGGQ